jgi:DNA-binding LacI/PurR family transcriptional regulator
MGAMRAVFDAGLTVPDDVAIIGIDDIEEGRYSRPSLSTVSLDTTFIAEQAIARVAARIEAPVLRPEQVVAPHALRVRESTSPSAR